MTVIRIPLIGACLFAATSAVPCGFHNYAPQPTLVDRLLGSDEIVLARSAPDNAFRFEAIKTLEGNQTEVEIPQLVDSVTRRRFAVDQTTSVLFARDGDYGPWQRLALIDAAMSPVLETVMARLPDWEVGDDRDRFAYFGSLLGHPDGRIHRLALRELDQADYGVLRDLGLEVDPAKILRRLDDPNESDLRPVRILLLGLSGSAQARARIEAGVESSVASDGNYVGAFATALIELAGPEAVTDIASSYLTDRNLPLFTRELLVEAVALHGRSGNPAMESAVIEAIESALWVDPAIAGAVARQFGSRSDWTFQTSLSAMAADGSVTDARDQQDVVQYVTLAQEFGDQD